MNNISMLMIILTMSCSTTRYINVINDKGEDLEKVQAAYDFVNNVFRMKCPFRVTYHVDRTDFGFSHFKPKKNAVYIAFKHLSKLDRTFSHELAHLCLNKITSGASVQEGFRFIDEGFADLIGFRYISKESWYKKKAFKVAKDYSSKRKISFKLAQDWSTYFGSPPGKVDFNSYFVGATFIYFIQEKYGDDSLFSFFEELKMKRDLSSAIKIVFAKDKKQFELEWLNFIENFEA